MLSITIACVGKVKETYLREGLREFEKRLSAYCRMHWIEVGDEATPAEASPADEARILQIEGERLLKVLPAQSYRIALAIDGKERSSKQLSAHIDSLALAGNSHLVFVIGGSLGLCDRVLAVCNERLSFSRMTFPHQMMRLLLLEQLYRSFRISRGEPYHK